MEYTSGIPKAVQMHTFEFPFSPTQQHRFRSGELMNEWATRYPMLFDEHDMAICKNQPDYHFFEWLASVVLYEATGYLSAVEKYETMKHTRKFIAFKQTVPREVFDYVLSNRSGVPDLFVYAADFSDWFFCEIKGGKDFLRPHQIIRFGELEHLSGKPVAILKFDEMTKLKLVAQRKSMADNLSILAI